LWIEPAIVELVKRSSLAKTLEGSKEMTTAVVESPVSGEVAAEPTATPVATQAPVVSVSVANAERWGRDSQPTKITDEALAAAVQTYVGANKTVVFMELVRHLRVRHVVAKSRIRKALAQSGIAIVTPVRTASSEPAEPKIDPEIEAKALRTAQYNALKAWEKGGKVGERPDTTELDKRNAEIEAEKAEKRNRLNKLVTDAEPVPDANTKAGRRAIARAEVTPIPKTTSRRGAREPVAVG
jgi:hypothetical protein